MGNIVDSPGIFRKPEKLHPNAELAFSRFFTAQNPDGNFAYAAYGYTAKMDPYKLPKGSEYFVIGLGFWGQPKRLKKPGLFGNTVGRVIAFIFKPRVFVIQPMTGHGPGATAPRRLTVESFAGISNNPLGWASGTLHMTRVVLLNPEEK